MVVISHHRHIQSCAHVRKSANAVGLASVLDRAEFEVAGRVFLQGVPLIATSPVRHELPHNMQPTPVEVHKYSAPWHDFTATPTPPPDLDEARSPTPPAGVVGGLACSGEALGLLDHPGVALSSCESLAESLDDDTVVSLDELTDVMVTQSSRYVAGEPPPPISEQHPAISEFIDARF